MKKKSEEVGIETIFGVAQEPFIADGLFNDAERSNGHSESLVIG